ncbi:hypothetical protein [Paenibacillus sp. NPDC057967]|uniref:hypothetical protein n=1 Tax=Paenibacillus sp. NPDC057967 TaxID=3346293 RepID=UPI0036DF33F3
MSYTNKAIASNWVDDHLDLYNFAVSIGDTAWQQHISQKLRDSDRHIQEEIVHHVRMELWLRFDSINQKMLELYEQLRSANHSETEKLQLQEKVLEFKIQRINICNKLKAQHTARQS